MAKYSIKYRRKGTKTWKKMNWGNITYPLDEAKKNMERLEKAPAKPFVGIEYNRKWLAGSEFEFRLKKWGR
jgi:hypothetical protein